MIQPRKFSIFKNRSTLQSKKTSVPVFVSFIQFLYNHAELLKFLARGLTALPLWNPYWVFWGSVLLQLQGTYVISTK